MCYIWINLALALPNQPYLHVKNVGQLLLPLSETQAQELIKVCTQASYGLNGARITDINVRESYELDPSNFEIEHPDWQIRVDQLAKRAVNELTKNKTANLNITTKLHKMLLYQKNGHFTRHQDDPSKDKNMFGTLIIQLPSDYTGGEFVAYYRNEKKVFDFGQLLGKFFIIAFKYNSVFKKI